MNKADLLERVKPVREKWVSKTCPVVPDPVGPGQESVWNFPRPPVVQEVSYTLKVEHAGFVIASTNTAIRVIETAGAPVYYFPPNAVQQDLLKKNSRQSICEWKGIAVYFDLHLGSMQIEDVAFCYPDPLDDLRKGYRRIAGYFAFYADRLDKCLIDEILVTPQPGRYYAGWVSPELAGPIKGCPGSENW